MPNFKIYVSWKIYFPEQISVNLHILQAGGSDPRPFQRIRIRFVKIRSKSVFRYSDNPVWGLSDPDPDILVGSDCYRGIRIWLKQKFDPKHNFERARIQIWIVKMFFRIDIRQP